MLWKGRLQFKQYIPNKHSRFGIKYFSLCESTGYMWNSFVYLGKPKNISHEESQLIKELGISGTVVSKLMSELYNKGYHLYMDNWYTSEKLFKHLEPNGTPACGTARKNRLSVPLSLNQQKLQKGAFSYRRNGNMLMMKYQDKKEVYFLSSIHQATSKVTGKKKQGIDVAKPVLVLDYNKYMGGIDRNDAMLGNYSSVRKSMKWTTKVAFHFMEESILNAFYLFDKVVGGQRLLQFKLNIIRALFDTSNEISPFYNLPPFGRHFLE